jgi:hypothetical protein
MIKYEGEVNVARKLISFIENDKNNNAFRTLYDMVRCYDKLKSCDFDFTQKYSIDELHLYLAALASYKKNVTIKYSENDYRLEVSDDAFSLKFAENTDELKSVGTEMDICVGSYADDAVNKECRILVLRDINNNKPVGCIELNNNGTVKQAKGPHNRLLQNKEKEFVENWIKDKGLSNITHDLSLN